MDKELWVTFDDCDEKHFIIGNPHTFVGRVHAYCPKKDTYFNFSLSEVKDMSLQGKYWLKGYLSGSEPAPPVDEDGDPYPPDHEDELHWAKSVELFHQTGNWYHGERYCDGCGERLLYSYIGLTCVKCSTQSKTDDSSC